MTLSLGQHRHPPHQRNRLAPQLHEIQQAARLTQALPDTWAMRGTTHIYRKLIDDVIVEASAYLGPNGPMLRTLHPTSGQGVIFNAPSGPHAVPLNLLQIGR